MNPTVVSVGYVASIVVVVVAIGVLQRERTAARDGRRAQRPQVRVPAVAVMVVGLAALLYFTILR